MWVQFKDTITPSSASRSPLSPLSIGPHPCIQLRTNLDIATLHPRLRFGFTLPRLSCASTTPSPATHQRTPPSCTAVPRPHDLVARANQLLADFKELDQQLEEKMHLKLPSPPKRRNALMQLRLSTIACCSPTRYGRCNDPSTSSSQRERK